MKIESHNISQNSSHLKTESYKKEETLRSWLGQTRPDFEDSPPNPAASSNLQMDRVSLSPKSLQLGGQATAAHSSEVRSEQIDEKVAEDPKLLTIRLILESLTGKKIKVANLKNVNSSPVELQTLHPPGQSGNQDRVGWGLEYDMAESYSEHEEMLFESVGLIVTEDGQKIDFSLSLKMERQFTQTHSIQIRAGDALLVDPLVINFAGSAAELTSAKFEFDLDSDGEREQISHLKPGSGFLFLDLNEDHVATNGAELFGPRTNNGFLELQEYDVDHNGWLDENDPIFEQLQIWSKDAAGSDYFSSLAEKNIGAIFLDGQKTEFSLKDHTQEFLGEVVATSVFIREQGSAGTIQEINLVI